MTTIKKRQLYPLWFFSWRPKKNNSVTPYVFFHDDQIKTTVLPPMFYLINFDSVTPYVFFPWWLIKNNSDTPYILFEDNFLLFFNMFFFITTYKIRQCYPLYFIWQRQQCYPLCFFSWRPIKNNSVTLYVFFSLRPIKNDSVISCGFFHDDE